MIHVERILVPMDFSPEAMVSLEWAVEIARQKKAQTIVVLHVRRALIDPAAGALGKRIDDPDVLSEDGAQSRMSAVLAGIPPTIKARPLYTIGRAAMRIARVAQQERADLVVMAAHERPTVDHWLRAGVADETVRLVACPVLVLHLNGRRTGAPTRPSANRPAPP